MQAASFLLSPDTLPGRRLPLLPPSRLSLRLASATVPVSPTGPEGAGMAAALAFSLPGPQTRGACCFTGVPLAGTDP